MSPVDLASSPPARSAEGPSADASVGVATRYRSRRSPCRTAAAWPTPSIRNFSISETAGADGARDGSCRQEPDGCMMVMYEMPG